MYVKIRSFLKRENNFTHNTNIYSQIYYLLADEYFKINKYSRKYFYDGVKLKDRFEKKPRILDMCFVDFDNEIRLVYIDADNKRIVVRCITNDSELKEEKLPHEPNRLAKIDNTTVGVIYKKELHILIFDVKKMERKISYSIIEGSITESKGRIQGILALSPTELILSDKIHLFRCNLHKQRKTAKVKQFAPSLQDFDTARRLTQVTVSRSSFKDIIFVADENDKKLTSIETRNGNFIDEHTEHNRGLQNVRAIGATEHRVYAATSAGISVFCHKEGTFKEFDSADYKMIVEYRKHVEHTRGLCIHLDKDYIYIGLSCVIKQDDVILIFKFKPDNSFI